MTFLKSIRGTFLLYGAFVALCAGWIIADMLASPSEQQRAILFGLSLPRLVLTIGLFLALLFFASLALISLRNPAWTERFAHQWFGGTRLSRGLMLLSSISLGLGWIGVFLPTYRMGNWVNYWMRVQPLLVFILLAGLATLIVMYRIQAKSLNVAAFKPVLPIFAICVAVFGLMFIRGFGVVSVTEDFWYGPGMPLLMAQLLLVILAGVLFLHFGAGWTTQRADVLICIFLFIVTAFLWARAPLEKSFLFTGFYPPNYAFYPFADAANFDIGSQFALIGQKIFAYNTLFFERPLYLSFLVYLHALFGQNYETLMAVQAIVYAVLSVLIFLIGRSLNMRVIGFAAALIVMFRGLNAISASNLIDTAGPKMMLTDFPAALGVALVTLFVCEWLKEPEQKWHYPLWVGGAIGFTLMLRTNALILLALLPVYTLLVFKTRWKPWLLSSFLILLGLIVITLPWELRNQANGGQMYGPIVGKFRAVIQTRYPGLFHPDGSAPQEDPLLSSVRLMNTRVLISLYERHPVPQNATPCDTIPCFSANHFLHNLLTSVLVIPTSPMLEDLRPLTKEVHLYWRADWDGKLRGAEPYLLLLNLFLIATGIAVAWREKRWAGLAPLAVFLIYTLSNALARTSGGRYVVPMDWIIPLYYLLGLFYVIVWLANGAGKQWSIFATPVLSPATGKAPASKMATALVSLLLLGGLIPLSETLYLPRFQASDGPQEILADNRALIESAGIKLHELEEFLQTPGADVFIGRVLYPRYYQMGQGEFQNAFYPFHNLPFPRTAFKLIGPAGEQSIVLPGEIPAELSHTSDALVLGCKTQNYHDALVVIVLDEEKSIHLRQPEAPLECPLPQPVCNNNSVCR